MKGYWQLTIDEVLDRKERRTEIHSTLDSWLMEVGSDETLALPRAGESFWLIDDETFQRLVVADLPDA